MAIFGNITHEVIAKDSGSYRIGPIEDLPYTIVAQMEDYIFTKTSEFDFTSRKDPFIKIFCLDDDLKPLEGVLITLKTTSTTRLLLTNDTAKFNSL